MLRRSQCALQPLSPGDRDRLFHWRNSDRIRAVMFNKNLIPRQEHDRWFDRVLTDRNSCYLIFLLDDRPCGLVNFPHIDRTTGICRWGFYLGETDLPPEAGRAMGFIGLERAFNDLQLQTVIGETLAANVRGIRFHERLRFERWIGGDTDPAAKRREGVLEFQMHHSRWTAVRQELGMAIFLPDGGRP